MKKMEEMINKVWQQIDKGLDNGMTDERLDNWEQLFAALGRLPIPDERLTEAEEDQQPRVEQPPPQPRVDQPPHTSTDPLAWSNLDRVDFEPPTPPAKKRWSKMLVKNVWSIIVYVHSAHTNYDRDPPDY